MEHVDQNKNYLRDVSKMSKIVRLFRVTKLAFNPNDLNTTNLFTNCVTFYNDYSLII